MLLGALTAATIIASAQTKVPRTAWGVADLQGLWNTNTLVPLERPREFGTRAVMTAAEHAKALYYLSEVFTALGEGERARECLDQLNDSQFAGLEYQRRAQRDEEERNKKKQ